MRVLVQVVNRASLSVSGKEISSIRYGFVVYVGFTHTDSKEVIIKAAKKVARLRIFPDTNNRTNLNIEDVEGEILSVSQFTLYADATEANRPSFSCCMAGDLARDLYNDFNEELRKYNIVVKEGVFGADMQINQENSGPFSITLEF